MLAHRSRILGLAAWLGLMFLVACSDDPVSPILKPHFSTSTSAVTVSNLWVATGSAYKVVPGGHVVGAKKYTDRSFTFASIPTELQGLTYIQTANADKSALPGNTQFLKFTVDQPATVYVAHSTQIAPPKWLASNFTDTGLKVTNTTYGTKTESYEVFKKDFAAGTVTLGSNSDATTGYGHYTVMVKPSGTTATSGSTSGSSAGGPDYGAIVRGVRPRGFGATAYALSAPAGGKAYYVATTGSDANAGTSSAPFRTINHAAQVARAGDVVTIGNGTYQESVSVLNSGTATQPIVFQAQNRGGVVLSGGRYTFQPAAWYGGKISSGQFYITLKGLIFRDYSDPLSTEYAAAAVRPTKYWRIDDCLFDRAGRTAIAVVDDNVTITRSTLQYNYIQALSAFGRGSTDPLKGLQITDVILRGNYTNTQTVTGSTSSTVIKFGGTSGTLIDNLESYENNGAGVWFDADNSNYVIRNSYIHNNLSKTGMSPGRGIHLELSWGPGLVENNVIANNAAEGLAISNSQGVEFRYNLVVGNRECMRLSDWVSRSGTNGEYALKNLKIHHNQFRDWKQNSCINPYGDRPGGLAGSTGGLQYSNIVLDYNTYQPVTNANLSGWWGDKAWITTISQMRGIGAEANGQIGTVQWPY